MASPNASTSRPPRRTYGRARQDSASGLAAADAAPSMVFSTAALPTLSPSKSLLDSFTKRSDQWLGTTRNTLGEASSDPVHASDGTEVDDDDVEVTAEEIEAEFAKLRKAARPAATAAAAPAEPTSLPLAKSAPLFGSSSLTDLPSSLPSSPSKVTAAKSATATAASRTSPDPIETPRPPSQQQIRNHEVEIEHSTSSTHGSPARPAHRKQQRIIESDDDDGDAASNASLTPKAKLALAARPVPVVSPAPDVGPGVAAEEQVEERRGPGLGAMLFSDDDDDEPSARPARKGSTPPLETALPGLDDEEDRRVSPATNGKGLKPLSKSEQNLMRRDIARAQREKQVSASRPETQKRPVSAWMARAHSVAPGSSQAGSSQPGSSQNARSPPLVTSDDIQQFTPSSGPIPRQRQGAILPTSSPTPVPHEKSVRFARPAGEMSDKERQEADERLAKLRAFKLNYVAKMAKGKEKSLNFDVEDDFVIRGEPAQAKLAFTPTKPNAIRKVSEARALLDRTAAIPAPNRNQQQFRRWAGAGKHGRKEDPTETHIAFAGKQFGHANLKGVNAGSRPVGQKTGRDEIITRQQVDNQMRARHQQQVRALAKAKEEQYGKGRELPEKHALDLAALVNSSATAAGAMNEDNEDDDSDFVPSEDETGAIGSGDDQDSHPDIVEGTLTEESGEDPVPEESGEDPVPEDAENPEDNKENHPAPKNFIDLEDDDVPFQPSKNLPKGRRNRRVLGSDDEDEAEPDPPRDLSLREAAKGPSQAVAANGFEGFELDLAGFGSAGGGFSQLFGETQGPEAAGSNMDGFEQLRAQQEAEAMLVPTAFLLPDVDISESQIRRDNELIAAEIAEAREPVQSVRKKKYLNSQGFFTQTRPPGRELTPTTDVDDDDDLAMAGTLKSSSTLLNSETHTITSPSADEEQSFTRLRRRKSASPDTTPTKAVPKDAFKLLQQGAARDAANQARHKPVFLDEQAEESDEDLDGWGINRGKDDEEDGEDLDAGYVPELLDDKVMDDEEKEREAGLAAEKFREVEKEDDARREAETKKVTAGHYRVKRRGNDFMSDEEDEEGKPRRWTKKQRRQRRLEGEDGLFKLGDEANVFLEEYEADLVSDDEELEEADPSRSPAKPTMSAHELQLMLRARARMNHSTTLESTELFAAVEEGSTYAISSKRRVAVTTTDEHDEPWDRHSGGRSLSRTTRSVAEYTKIVADESINSRRVGGGGVSVVVAKSERMVSRVGRPGRAGASGSGSGSGSHAGTESRGLGRQGSSILMDRNKRFGQ